MPPFAGDVKWSVVCDEQASDSLQLSILETLLRSVCVKPEECLLGSRPRVSYSLCENPAGGLSCCHTVDTHRYSSSPTMNVNRSHLCEYCVCSLHFDPVSPSSVTVNIYKLCISFKKTIHKIVSSRWNVKVSGVCSLSRFEWLSTFSLEVLYLPRMYCKAATQTKLLFLLFSRQVTGQINILLMAWVWRRQLKPLHGHF